MVIVGLGISPPWGEVSERASANCLSVKQNEGVFTLTLDEVLRGSPDVEASLGAAVEDAENVIDEGAIFVGVCRVNRHPDGDHSAKLVICALVVVIDVEL